MTDKPVNGWANRETWNVHMWLSNTESAYLRVRDVMTDNAMPVEQAEALRVLVRDTIQDLPASIAGDLALAALLRVDWDALAAAYAEDVE